ncbi:MAG: hypothetical protein IJI98_02925 [Methanosphaera sp.]|nr:hypothetical protein [Methanosphaera sp.]
MEYQTLKELYQQLIPAFNVKKRILSITKYKEITFEDIWQYLTLNKWRSSNDLTLAEMVNDIIIFDASSIKYL